MTKVKEVIIVGAGQHGHVVKNCITVSYLGSDFRYAGFLDDFQKKNPRTGILGKISEFRKYKSTNTIFHVAFGDNEQRKKIYLYLKKGGYKFANIRHYASLIEKDVELGENLFVGALTYINRGTKIGNNVIINNGCLVEHDNELASHSQLAPGVITGGGVKIGTSAFIGLRATLRDHISVGDNAIVGMRSVIVKDVPKNTMVHNKLSLVKKRNELPS